MIGSKVHRGVSYDLYFVLKGYVNGQEGERAIKAGGGDEKDLQADGWYFLTGEDLDGQGPWDHWEEAEMYAKLGIDAELESELAEEILNYVGELVKDKGFDLAQVTAAFNDAVQYIREN